MSKFNPVDEPQLVTLQQGLDILGHVDRTLLPSELYLYGILQNGSPALSMAAEATWEGHYLGDRPRDSVTIETMAVAIRLSDDVLQSLLGAGVQCNNSEFCFFLNNEPKMITFKGSTKSPVISASQLTHMALSNSSFWLDEYLKTEGMQELTSTVSRTKLPEGGISSEETPHTHQSSAKSSNRLLKDLADILSQPKGYRDGDF